MRLSTAIALGRTTVKEWKATKLDGCALGMARNAVGLRSEWDTIGSYSDIEAAWPWLSLPAKECPIHGCIYTNAINDSNLMLIAHIFDSHVADPLSHHDHWTLDQLIDFVCNIEPKEEDESEARTEQHTEVAVRKDPGVLSHSRHRGS